MPDNTMYSKLSATEKEDEEGLLSRSDPSQREGILQPTTRLALAALAIVLHTVAVVGVCKMAYGGDRSLNSIVVPNILEDIIEYKPQVYGDTDMNTHPFFGTPTEELDNNWSELLKCEYSTKGVRE